jgi:hypothetical protein
MKFSVSALLFASVASAHTIFQQIYINGVAQTRHNFMRLPEYDGVRFTFSTSFLAAVISCEC